MWISKCSKHGEKEATFVCQHIANSLLTNVSVGFYWSKDSDSEFPDAWCKDCEDRCSKTGDEWKVEALEELNVKLLCSGCYLVARKMELGY